MPGFWNLLEPAFRSPGMTIHFFDTRLTVSCMGPGGWEIGVLKAAASIRKEKGRSRGAINADFGPDVILSLAQMSQTPRFNKSVDSKLDDPYPIPFPSMFSHPGHTLKCTQIRSVPRCLGVVYLGGCLDCRALNQWQYMLFILTHSISMVSDATLDATTEMRWCEKNSFAVAQIVVQVCSDWGQLIAVCWSTMVITIIN